MGLHLSICNSGTTQDLHLFATHAAGSTQERPHVVVTQFILDDHLPKPHCEVQLHEISDK